MRPRRLRAAATGERGMALAAALLVVALLTGIGVVAVNATTYDQRSAGALERGTHARLVAHSGMALGRCTLCESLDGITVTMGRARGGGQPAEVVLRTEEIEGAFDPATAIFEDAVPPTIGSFGLVNYERFARLTIDRPIESARASGYSLREGSGSDSGALCFRRLRVTSQGVARTRVGVGPGTDVGDSVAFERAYVVAGPIDCTMTRSRD